MSFLLVLSTLITLSYGSVVCESIFKNKADGGNRIIFEILKEERVELFKTKTGYKLEIEQMFRKILRQHGELRKYEDTVLNELIRHLMNPDLKTMSVEILVNEMLQAVSMREAHIENSSVQNVIFTNTFNIARKRSEYFKLIQSYRYSSNESSLSYDGRYARIIQLLLFLKETSKMSIHDRMDIAYRLLDYPRSGQSVQAVIADYIKNPQSQYY